MSDAVLLDSGQLVAYLDRREQYHEWATRQFASLVEPLLICEAAVSEACFLLTAQRSAVAKIGEYLERGALSMVPVGRAAQARLFALMAKYRKVPMSYADACLVWLAESNARSRVFTLDADFGIYRLDGSRPIPVIAPWAVR